jgi:hypothetical protein
MRTSIRPRLRGRPTAYRSEYARQGEHLCRLGATDAQLAEAFGVNADTIYVWKRKHRHFAEALKRGKSRADAQVAEALYRRAVGFTHDQVRIFRGLAAGKARVIPYAEYYPPDTTACIFWLKSRWPAQWKDRQAVEHSGPGGGALAVEDCWNPADLEHELARREAATRRTRDRPCFSQIECHNSNGLE